MKSLKRRTVDYLRFERNPGGIDALDGLRGIAILMVLFRHGIRPFYDPGSATLPIGGWDLMTPMTNGWMGVDLFFVLSGFLVTHHILRRWGQTFRWGDVSQYFTKRVLRIVPAYYAFLFLVVSGWVPFYTVPQDNLSRQTLHHVLFLQDYIPGNIVVAFWALGVEEKFYFLIPLLMVPLLRVRSTQTRLRAVGMLICIPLALRIFTYLRHDEFVSYAEFFWTLRSPFHLACDALLIGTLCAMIFHHRHEFPQLENPRVSRALFWGGTAWVGYLLCARPLLNSLDWFRATLMFPALALGFAAILLSLVLKPGRYAQAFRSPTLFFFSKISYSLYLVHMVFIDSVFQLASHIPGFKTLPPGEQFLIYMPLYTIISITAALALHYLVEKPFLLLKDFDRSSARRRAPAPQLSGQALLGS